MQNLSHTLLSEALVYIHTSEKNIHDLYGTYTMKALHLLIQPLFLQCHLLSIAYK